MNQYIDTDQISIGYRNKAIDIQQGKLLITNFYNTEQEKDFSEPANCNGFGRIRHFHTSTSDGWPVNTLPIDPACKALGIKNQDSLNAQVFQNAVCNWRCWYCYVPFNLLSANSSHSSWLSPSELVDLYLNQENPPKMIDLSGGQPDLIPEWIPWMMRELKSRKLDEKIYLWSDDNLSTDYFWRYLTEEDIELIKSYKNYGKVCCFKGFDPESFSFNTKAEPQLFFRQFELLEKYLKTGIDLYGYISLTTTTIDNLKEKMTYFFDKLQDIDYYFPLRIIPLEIKVFSPVTSRMNDNNQKSIYNQTPVIKEWNEQLHKRYNEKELSITITEIPMGKKK